MMSPAWIRLAWLRFALAIMLALTIPAVTAPAFAQDDKARVVELIGEANASYDAGNFRDALQKYKEVYDITEDPRVLYRIGLTYENLSNYQRAREHLELFLLAEPDSRAADKVRAKIDTLKESEATLQAAISVESTPSGADVWIDGTAGKPAGVTPVRIPVGPGEHTLLLRKEGHEDVEDTVTVEKSTVLERSYDLGGGGDGAEVATEGETDDAAEVAETTTETAAEPANVQLTGTPQRVEIGPPMGVSVMSWIAIGVGWGILAFAGTDTAAGGAVWGPGVGYYGSGFLLGAGLITLGVYFLWIKDYTASLPAARTAKALGLPPARAFGLSVDF